MWCSWNDAIKMKNDLGEKTDNRCSAEQYSSQLNAMKHKLNVITLGALKPMGGITPLPQSLDISCLFVH